MEILTAVEVRDESEVITDVEVAALMAPLEELPAAAAPPAPPPMTAEEALRQAEAEELTLLKSSVSNSGFMHVTFKSDRPNKPYRAHVRRGGEQVTLGFFETSEEAALCYARSPEAHAAFAAAAAPPAPPPMTAEEALRQAEAEGLTLLKSESSNTGYKGVSFGRKAKAKPYHAQVQRGGKPVTLGYFATAEEAALAYARTPEAQAAVAAAAAPSAPPPMTAEEALRQAEAEGLTLLRSESSKTGYKGVRFTGGMTKPYQAQVKSSGKSVALGTFATAAEAALAYARSPEAQAAVAAAAAPPAPPPMTAEEAMRQAEAEGLTLLRSENSNSGYKCVTFNSNKKLTSPYQAKVWRGGKEVHLGMYATPEEAALSYARTSEAQAAAPQPPATSSRKRKVRSEEQPPDMPAGVVVILEGRFVESATFG
tara:strand:+ start:256 stop:1530 length:1275 start_codon:yes stop_codon:yes gene_type:complete